MYRLYILYIIYNIYIYINFDGQNFLLGTDIVWVVEFKKGMRAQIAIFGREQQFCLQGIYSVMT